MKAFFSERSFSEGIFRRGVLVTVFCERSLVRGFFLLRGVLVRGFFSERCFRAFFVRGVLVRVFFDNRTKTYRLLKKLRGLTFQICGEPDLHFVYNLYTTL